MRFQYSVLNSSQDELDSLPRVPITLFNGNARVRALGIVDSGATVSVLPYAMGLDLGAVWDEELQNLELTGNLARVPSIPIALSAERDGLGRVTLVFAWSRSNDVPLILGQYNFFKNSISISIVPNLRLKSIPNRQVSVKFFQSQIGNLQSAI